MHDPAPRLCADEVARITNPKIPGEFAQRLACTMISSDEYDPRTEILSEQRERTDEALHTLDPFESSDGYDKRPIFPQQRIKLWPIVFLREINAISDCGYLESVLSTVQLGYCFTHGGMCLDATQGGDTRADVVGQECPLDHRSPLRLAYGEAMKGLKNWDSTTSSESDADVDDWEAEAMRMNHVDVPDSTKKAQEAGRHWWHCGGQVPKTPRQWNLCHTIDINCEVDLCVGGRPG